MNALFINLISGVRARFEARLPSLFAVAVALIFAWPHTALAQGPVIVITGGATTDTVGDLVCNVYNNFGPFAPFLSAVAWVFGGVLIGSGLIMLRDHADSGSSNAPLHRAIARIIGGALLMTVPIFTKFVIDTIFIAQTAGGGSACVPGGVQAAGGDIGLDVLMENFVDNIEGPLVVLISIMAFIMGVIFMIRGLVKAAKYGTDPRANSVPHILTYIIVGALLIAFADNFNSIFASIFGGTFGGFQSVDVNEATVVQWTAVVDLGGNAAFATAIAAALTFFQLIGLIAFFRGWYIVKNAIEGAGQATIAQGFTHIIGGVMAINIYSMLEILDTTFGTNLLG